MEREMPLVLWKVSNLFLMLSLSSLSAVLPKSSRAAFGFGSKAGNPKPGLPSALLWSPTSWRGNNIKSVKITNNTAEDLKKKMLGVPLYRTGAGLLLMGSLKLIFSNIFAAFCLRSVLAFKASLTFCKHSSQHKLAFPFTDSLYFV